MLIASDNILICAELHQDPYFLIYQVTLKIIIMPSQARNNALYGD